MTYLEENSILGDEKRGFCRLYSCESQFLEFFEELTASLDRGGQVDVVVMDFVKAFSKVNHLLLIHKLSRYGICGSIYSWVASFLRDWRQSVVVDGHRGTSTDWNMLPEDVVCAQSSATFRQWVAAHV
ncbi:uncharacterized protein LOC143300024 [Babylonia areolata]|uniref:uncharacterized protein LOC143300024 n=1 Tax=Babylonia areolata TaxID=304850 RepID=UPI003FD4A976